MGAESRMVGNDEQYEFKEVRAIRATSARTTRKWQESGWELVSENHGQFLQTKLTFRRPKPKTPWRLLAVSGGVLVVMAMVVGSLAAVKGDGGAPEAVTPPTETQVAQGTQPSEEPIAKAAAKVPEAEEYRYQGPQYEIVIVDRDQSVAKLNQHWVHTSAFDYSTDDYKDHIKLIIADIARAEGTNDFIAEVVTDREVAEAESPSTYEKFIAEHGMDYAMHTIPEKEELAWVASYTGGFDAESGEASSSPDAYEVVWFIAADAEFEKWKPTAAG